ncbi:hypothetical protein RI367_001888 [Sorochytrium milnesiophthora]
MGPQSRAYVPEQWLFSRDEVNAYYAHPRRPADNVVVLRDKAIHIIGKVAQALQIPQVTVSSACTFFHRFYIRRNFSNGKPVEIAATCLFIACKTEETLQKVEKFSACVSNITAKGDATLAEQNHARWKRIILEFEPIVCEALAFDLYVAHPHRLMLSYLDSVKADKSLRSVAYRLLCDSFRLPLCLRFQPHVIGAGFIALAMQTTGIPIPDLDDGTKWYQKFDVSKEELDEVGQEYTENQTTDPKQLIKSLGITLPEPILPAGSAPATFSLPILSFSPPRPASSPATSSASTPSPSLQHQQQPLPASAATTATVTTPISAASSPSSQPPADSGKKKLRLTDYKKRKIAASASTESLTTADTADQEPPPMSSAPEASELSPAPQADLLELPAVSPAIAAIHSPGVKRYREPSVEEGEISDG